MDQQAPYGYSAPAQSPALAGGTVTWLIALILVVPIIGPLIALVYCIVNVKRRGSLPLMFGALFVGFCHLVLSMIAAVMIPTLNHVSGKGTEAEVKVNLHAIQLALERYAVDQPDSAYPADLRVLVTEGYLPEFPQNPYKDRPMQQIALGDPDWEGEFTYVAEADDGGKVNGYVLYAYGSEKTEGQDVDGDGVPDHVIIKLFSAMEEGAAGIAEGEQ